MSTGSHRPARGRRAVPAALVGALTAMVLMVLPPSTASAAARAVADAVPAADPADPELIAQTQAHRSGHAVVVTDDTTPYSQVRANPDGTFTLTTANSPQRARSGDKWVPVRADLHAGPDGRYAPVAAISSVSLSGGGTGPMATFDDGAGHRISLTMPMPLPAPSVDGATALYPEALSGVDLSVTATVEGGIREVLIVKNAKAAAASELAQLRMAVSETGLTLATAPDGAINATDSATGTPIFTAPTPVMWDSTASRTAVTGSKGNMAATPGATAVTVTGDPATSTTAGPGAGATVTVVPVTASATSITLTPPAAALTGSAVTYPAYIDPALSPSPALNHKAYTQSYYPTRTEWNPTDSLRVGFDNWDTNCGSPCYKAGITRSYLNFTGLAPLALKQILSASLVVTQRDGSCTNSETMYAAITSGNAGFSSSLDWSNQPAPSGVKDSRAFTGTNGAYTVKLTNVGPYIARHSYTNVNLDLYSASEGDHCGYRHLSVSPTLSFTYLSTPKAPTGLAEVNGGTKYSCAGTSPGTSVTAATGNQIQLTASFATPDKGQGFTGNLYVSSNNGSTYTHYSKALTETSTGVAIPFTQTIAVTSGTLYRWYATGTVTGKDIAGTTFTLTGTAPSGAPGSAGCYFTYNGVNPSAPTVTSAAYPGSGPTTVTVGGSGSLTISAVSGGDPNPVKSFNYGLNGTGVTDGAMTGTGPAASGSYVLTVPLAKLHWGTNTVFVQSVDTVNAVSTVAMYPFYVQQGAFGPYTLGTAGDIDGDNVPDLVTVDAAGNIRLYGKPETAANDGTAGDLAYGGTVIVPADHDPAFPGATFSGALVTHAGSFIAHNTDDLLVEQVGLLYVAENTSSNGTAWTFSPANGVVKPACSSCPHYNSSDWSAVTQMVAIPTTPGNRPDLLTMERWDGQTQLWLYPPQSGSLAFGSPTLISANSRDWTWDTTQLLAGGAYPGVAGTGVIVRDLNTSDIDMVPDITHLPAGKPAVRVVGQGFTADYPLVSSTGQADSNGNWPIWATDDSATLNLFQATTAAGVSTLAGDGEPHPLSSEGWGIKQLSLGSTYAAPDHPGLADDGTVSTTGSFDGLGYSYSAAALAGATLGDGFLNGCAWASGCVTGLALGQPVVDTNADPNHVYHPYPTANGTLDNWLADGVTLPVPPDSNGNATSIAFLGAATNVDNDGATGQATVTFTDGHTQSVPITFSDWTLNNGDATPAAGTKIVAKGGHRANVDDGTQDPAPAYLYATVGTPLRDNGQTLTAAGVQVASVTLPDNPNLAIFGISIN